MVQNIVNLISSWNCCGLSDYHQCLQGKHVQIFFSETKQNILVSNYRLMTVIKHFSEINLLIKYYELSILLRCHSCKDFSSGSFIFYITMVWYLSETVNPIWILVTATEIKMASKIWSLFCYSLTLGVGGGISGLQFNLHH